MKIKEENYNKGRYGEEMARKYLEEKGYELIEANYKNKIGEIDLIMSDNEWLVFVEVKYKSDDRRGMPEEMIGRQKLGQVRKIAESYVHFKKTKYQKYRIDAVCILGKTIKHYQNLY